MANPEMAGRILLVWQICIVLWPHGRIPRPLIRDQSLSVVHAQFGSVGYACAGPLIFKFPGSPKWIEGPLAYGQWPIGLDVSFGLSEIYERFSISLMWTEPFCPTRMHGRLRWVVDGLVQVPGCLSAYYWFLTFSIFIAETRCLQVFFFCCDSYLNRQKTLYN